MELDILRRKSGNVNSLISKFAQFEPANQSGFQLPANQRARRHTISVPQQKPVRQWRALSTPEPPKPVVVNSELERRESISLISRVINKRRNTLSLSPNLTSVCEKENSCNALSTQVRTDLTPIWSQREKMRSILTNRSFISLCYKFEPNFTRPDTF